jgi:hypothetical protein
VVYSRTVEDTPYTFGVSGRLYKSNVLLYDHQTESLWSQLMEKAISGKLVDKKLTKLSSSRTKWKTWKKKNPDTKVLSTKTGYSRDYGRDPYEGYYRLGTIWFPVGDVRKDLAPKERVLGIDLGGESKAYQGSGGKSCPTYFQLLVCLAGLPSGNAGFQISEMKWDEFQSNGGTSNNPPDKIRQILKRRPIG